MNKVLIDILTNPSLRDGEALEAHIIHETSAGTPWLVEG